MQTSEIREHMPIVGSDDRELGTVDRVEGDYIKLTKSQGESHHWIPCDWVRRVDDRVHVDRSAERAMTDWMATPPEARGQR